MSSSGTITIRPLAANLQHDVDLFGKMDPYCLITLGTQQWKSMICKNGGKTPTWSDEVTFMVQPGVDIMRVALYDDKTIGSDKLIGEGVIPVDKLFNYNGPFEEKIPLTFKAKPCGFIQLRFVVNKGEQMAYGEKQVLQGYEQHSPKIMTGAAQIPQTTTVPETQKFVENLPQQPIPTTGAQTFTAQSMQYGPKAAEVKGQKSPSSSPSPDKKKEFIAPQTSGQVVSGSSVVPGMQAYVTMPQCCLNAVQQHHPGFVPGTTGYTGDIPHHQHVQ